MVSRVLNPVISVNHCVVDSRARLHESYPKALTSQCDEVVFVHWSDHHFSSFNLFENRNDVTVNNASAVVHTFRT